MISVRTLIATLAVLLLAACGTTPLKKFDVNGANDALNEWSCSGARTEKNEECHKAYGHDDDPIKDRGFRAARLLRAHGVLVMFARYAVARYPDYSDDLVNDATRMIGRLESARAILAQLTKVANQDTARGDLYPVDRVDGFISLVEVAEAATKPTRRFMFKLVTVSSVAERIDGGTDILKNALKDLLYLDAYRLALENLRKSVAKDTTNGLKNVIEKLDDQLKQYCGELGRMAKLQNKTCLPPAKPSS